jgi:hypothetical protein
MDKHKIEAHEGLGDCKGNSKVMVPISEFHQSPM